MIIADFLIHTIVLALMSALWTFYVRFVKIIYKDLNRLSAACVLISIAPLLAYLTGVQLYSFIYCVCHYATWWNR